MIHTGGEKFNPTDRNIYFVAANTERLEHGMQCNNHLLMAVNELEGPDSRRFFAEALDTPGKLVFLDSGVFNLAMTHARKHNVSHNIGLSMAPDEIDGFHELFDNYVDLVRRYKDQLWGYIEIDQGGRENKIKTRAKLEAIGLRPIPVYHPLTDGWDYFDYLAERYDRICFGNIVKADRYTRQRLVATAWERHRKYPHLWIHLLGLTPNEMLNALPINSGDSSTWIASLRWPTFPVRSTGKTFSQLGRGYRYDREVDGSEPSGHIKATLLCGYEAHMTMLAWRRYLDDMNTLGFERYPAIVPGERERHHEQPTR